jgi:RNase P/RNase MRP subunit p30
MDCCLNSVDLVERAHQLGFKIIVLNKNIQPNEFSNISGFPNLPSVLDLRLHTRCTVPISNPNQLHAIVASHLAMKNFDLFAVRALNDTVLKAIAEQSSFDCIDILSFDLTQPILTFTHAKHLKQIISKGIKLEIDFACALRDFTGRINIINQAQLILKPFKNDVLFSSGAKNLLELRTPEDLKIFREGVLGLGRDDGNYLETWLFEKVKKRGIYKLSQDSIH